ncbi:hypothetical protein SAMN05421823_102585 [Catalinimonas alkaloidigena]|uniref:Uncharacterized protein n=1 Tax=Catalinimonas alkaloidigena TaxID=1075417 RepID=A0A1G9BDF5_9BACT|nr:hypothetical protein [Catalinimonas alkaloidigena]SDK37507.1 hypothetical protein SAMN05421823_102585 [Catalinimonas alkaloidigena]
MKNILLSGLAALLSLSTKAQNLAQFNAGRQRLERLTTLSLGTWSVGNLAVNGLMLRQSTGEAREFHRMNVYWNLVNLAFVGAGVYQWLRAQPPASYSMAETFAMQQRMEKLLLFNAGLDVGYIATGLYLRERANNEENHQVRWRGYGRALILQGGFLLLFDSTMFFFFNRHGRQLNVWLQRVEPAPTGTGFLWKF